MLKLTIELIDKLKPYENHIIRGYKGNYVCGLTKQDFDAMLEIYRIAGGKSNLYYACNSCTLRLMRELGAVYFSMLEEMAQKCSVSEDKDKNVELPKEDKKVSQRGRKKQKKED